MLKTVKDLKEKLGGIDESLEIVTDPIDHTYQKGIDIGEMLVEVDDFGGYCDTLEGKEKSGIKKVFFIGIY